MKRSKLLVVAFAMALLAIFATPVAAQDEPAITVDPANIAEAGETTFTVSGTGWTQPAIFILPCPVPESGDITELSVDQCDTNQLTPGAPADGTFSVEVTLDVPAEGIVIAAGDAGQVESAAALVTVGDAGGGGGGDASIAQIATDAGDFTTLLAALDIAGLAGGFSDCDAEPLTVFAPTDEAITSSLSALGLEAADVIADVELLTTVLTYHVVEGAVLSGDVVGLDGQEATTLQGEGIAIAADDSGVVLNGSVNVTPLDLVACNGVVHVIDGLLVPPTVLAALGAGGDDAGDDGADDGADAAGDDEALASTGSESGMIAIVGVTIALLGAMVLGTSRRFSRSS